MADSRGMGQLVSHDRDSDPGEPVADGVNFRAAIAPAGRTGTSGTVIVTADGRLTVRVYDVPRTRLAAALGYFGHFDPRLFTAPRPTTSGKTSAPGPAVDRGPRTAGSVLLTKGRVQARAFYEIPNSDQDEISSAMVTVSPRDPGAWPMTWWQGVGFLRTLTTGTPHSQARRPAR